MHDLPHGLRVPGHDNPHPEGPQTSPSTHLVSQLPQLFGSIDGSTHLLPHLRRGALHVEAHVPQLQTSSVLHAAPHPPQFLGSYVVSVHVPEQLVWPTGHTSPPPPASTPASSSSKSGLSSVLLEQPGGKETRMAPAKRSDAPVETRMPLFAVGRIEPGGPGRRWDV